MSSSSPLGEGIAALSRFLVGELTIEDALDRIAELTVSSIEPVDFVGLTMLVEGRNRTAVFTDPSSPEIDQAQYDTGDGPCLTSFQTGQVVSIESTIDDGPFRAFREAAAAHGILSTLSLPMMADPDPVGAMNLYSRTEHGFGDAERQAAEQFATQAGIVLANAQAYWDAHGLSQRLSEAMESRAVIEQAKGILMAAQQCSPDEAFDLLVAASQRENVKLREIARRIVTTTAAATSGGERTPPGSSVDGIET